MLDIVKYKNGHNYDVFCIKTEQGIFEISFQGNLDLYWRYIPNKNIMNCNSKHEFFITKENYFIYTAFNDLYESIKNNKPYSNLPYFSDFNDINFTDYNFENKLYKNEKIKWISDDFLPDNASSITIKKVNEEVFSVLFERSKNSESEIFFNTFSVRIANSGSRYYPFNISFMNMYNKLKQYDFEYHQIHIEEYMYKQKLLKKQK